MTIMTSYQLGTEMSQITEIIQKKITEITTKCTKITDTSGR